jgi:hypothetical protein
MATYEPNPSVSLTNPNALRPANDEDLLIKPKRIVNPILASGLHSALNREIKIKSKSGNLKNDKSELEKAFFSRKVKNTQKVVDPDEGKKPIELELSKILLGKFFFK